MLNFHKPGVYCIRAPNYTAWIAQQVEQWARFETLPDEPMFSWVTTQSTPEIHQTLAPLLTRRNARLKGLDVIQVTDQDKQSGVRELANLLQEISPLRPGVVFLDKLDQWLHRTRVSSAPLDSAQKILGLHRWCQREQIKLVGLANDTLPLWASHSKGLLDIAADGSTFTPWWHLSWGYQGQLWPSGSIETEHCLLSLSEYNSIGELGTVVHQMRLDDQHPSRAIHVHLQPWVEHEHAAVALIRLGANNVIDDLDLFKSAARISFDHGAESPTQKSELNSISDYASAWHETITPGQLRFLTPQAFSDLCRMVLRMARGWGMHCTLSRLPLRNHITCLQASQFMALLSLSASVTATSEAFFVFKVWPEEPSEQQIDTALQTFFSDEVETLFGGVLNRFESATIRALLVTLMEQPCPISTDQLETEFRLNDQVNLADIWNDAPTEQVKRPWLDRLHQLAKLPTYGLKA